MKKNYIWIEKCKNGLFFVDFIKDINHFASKDPIGNYVETNSGLTSEDVGQLMGGN